mmetsp:Transcript_25217/g.37611  ORF Transcript_25217/g.37611 Transcript_25217/m.37611 type:complete len:225 (-) Transcript_25217:586-1260(-)
MTDAMQPSESGLLGDFSNICLSSWLTKAIIPPNSCNMLTLVLSWNIFSTSFTENDWSLQQPTFNDPIIKDSMTMERDEFFLQNPFSLLYFVDAIREQYARNSFKKKPSNLDQTTPSTARFSITYPIDRASSGDKPATTNAIVLLLSSDILSCRRRFRLALFSFSENFMIRLNSLQSTSWADTRNIRRNLSDKGRDECDILLFLSINVGCFSERIRQKTEHIFLL